MKRALAAPLLILLLMVQGCVLHHAATRPPVSPPPAPTRSLALDDFAAARASELASARQALDDIVQATSKLAPARQVRPRGVTTVPFEVTDAHTGQSRTVDCFESLTVDLPLELRGTPEHDAAMVGVKKLAEQLASSRGGARIVRGFALADVQHEKIVLDSAVAKASGGQDIVVRKQSDAEVLRGFERISVHGNALAHRL